MANGVHGEIILRAQKHVEVDSKLEPVFAIILNHLKEEIHATEQDWNQEIVTLTLVQVFMFQ